MRRKVGAAGQCYEQVKGLAVHSPNDAVVHSNVWEVQGAGKWQRRNINFNRSLLPCSKGDPNTHSLIINLIFKTVQNRVTCSSV